jgi:NADH-quinone oxidoreductase subunit N
MSRIDIAALSPIIVLAATAIAVMLCIAFYRNHKVTALLTLAGLGAAFAALFIAAPLIPHSVTALVIVDGYGLFFMGLILLSSFVVASLSYGYLKWRGGNLDEFYLLLLLATLGSVILVVGGSFASLFLGLEILSVSLYSLIAYLRVRERGNEAGIKYLILAAVSASFLLFGMALVYARLGTMDFARIAAKAGALGNDPMLLAGFVLIIVGVGFKLAVVPFHMWTPDVYEGAPAPVTAFIATVSKGAMFVLLLRFFAYVEVRNYPVLVLLFSIIAAASMSVGNLLALYQQNVKRTLAYSSIAHQGYLLVAFLAGREVSVMAVSYYLMAYFVSMLGAFGVISVMSGEERDADAIEDYHGLAWRRPWVAGAFTVMLLSLAGIPLTAGFLGKYYVMAAGAGSALWVLVVLLAVNSAAGLYYYLRIVAVQFAVGGENICPSPPRMAVSASMTIAVLTCILFWLGIYPAAMIRIIHVAMSGRI